MTSQEYKPSHIPQLTPCLTVAEPESALSFYELAFGFETIGNPIVRDGQIVFAEMYCLEARIMLQRQGSFSSVSLTPAQVGVQQGIGLYLYIPNIEDHYDHAKSCGAIILSELLDTFWGDRIYTAKDLDGYLWTFAQRTSEPDLSDEPNHDYSKWFPSDSDEELLED